MNIKLILNAQTQTDFPDCEHSKIKSNKKKLQNYIFVEEIELNWKVM